MPDKSYLTVSKADLNISGEVLLTGSKSECNRALILNALSKGLVKVENISSSADTETLMNLLKAAATEKITVSDVGPAGTAMRFLTAYFAVTGYRTLLTGSERMKERPVGILVEALKTLGADIGYQEKEGYPPLQIGEKFAQAVNELKIKGNISSQYISALLLVAAALPQGLTLDIDGELTSKPYVAMTLQMLQQVGISSRWEQNKISIQNQQFSEATIYVEPDWSAASYWYSITALSQKGSRLFLKGLQEESLQGDSKIADIMQNFGVSSAFTDDGVHLEKVNDEFKEIFLDLKDCPDLAQTIVVLAAALKVDCAFTGLETLKIKETDRVKALQVELQKIGVDFVENDQIYKLETKNIIFPHTVTITTYEDHRMAMAFAPLAMRIKNVCIEDPEVVSKSYPDFWKDLEKTGFNIKPGFQNN